MYRYQKKPVIIEAYKYKDISTEDTNAYPSWILQALADGVIYFTGKQMFIKTLEGDHLVRDNDMIIKGVKGELYPCKPDIFELTYEKV